VATSSSRTYVARQLERGVHVYNKQCSRWNSFPVGVIAFCSEMKMKELTPKQLSAVPCPTCGVAAGKRCVLLSGAPRNEPHVDRKIAATEAVEKERFKSAAD